MSNCSTVTIVRVTETELTEPIRIHLVPMTNCRRGYRPVARYAYLEAPHTAWAGGRRAGGFCGFRCGDLTAWNAINWKDREGIMTTALLFNYITIFTDIMGTPLQSSSLECL